MSIDERGIDERQMDDHLADGPDDGDRDHDGRLDLLWPRPRRRPPASTPAAAAGTADGPWSSPGPTPAAGTTVVIVTHDSAEVIGACLRSLPVALAGLDPWEVIVVDNRSGDATCAVVRQTAPDARLVALDHNHGYAAGINAGIAAAGLRGDVLVLNPDVRLQPHSVAQLRAALARPGVGIAVPRIIDGTGTLQPSLRRRPTATRAWAEALLGGPRASARGDLGEVVAPGEPYDHEHEVDWATGAAFLVSRSCLDDIGPLDESFFLYSEETDYMLRAGDAGHAVRYTPTARALHLGGDLGTTPRLWAMRTVNRVRLQRRRSSRSATAGFLAASLFGEGARALAGRSTSRAALAGLARRGPGIVLGPPPVPEPALPGWICFSAQDWWYHNRAHSDFQLLRRVAERRRVLLVNSIGLRMPMPGRSSASTRRIARKVASVARLMRRPDPQRPGLGVVTPLPLPFYRSAAARRLGAWFVSRQVRHAARSAGVIAPGAPDPVVVVTIPTAIDAARHLSSRALVVNRSDKHSEFPEADATTIAALEERCLAAADLVVYSSHALLDDEDRRTPAPGRLLDHGVDADHFRRRGPDEVPADLAAIPGPRIGFFGALDDYLVDFDLLDRVAGAMPDASLVLIGDATCSLRSLAARPNVHLLGHRPYESIPAYGSGFDVALMPWVDTPWIHYANPIKLKEYLALGLPVVSTDFPEVHRYGHLLRIATSPSEFVAAIADTLDDGGPATPAERRAAVEALTWDRAAAQLLRDAEQAGRPPPSSSSSTSSSVAPVASGALDRRPR